MTYLEREILDSMDRYVKNDGKSNRVIILTGDLKGKEGVIQTFSHVKDRPLLEDKIRVWVEGYSCIDIFDFEVKNLERIPLEYIKGMGYF